MQKMPYTLKGYSAETTLVLFKFYYIYCHKIKITPMRELFLSFSRNNR